MELKLWISTYIRDKGKGSLHIAINNSKRIKDDILKYTDFLPIDAKYNQRCYHIINETYEVPKCKECLINNVNFNKQDWTYFKFCSKKCASNNDETKNNLKKSILSKYGVDNISRSSHFKDLMVKGNREKYGVDWYLQSEEFNISSIKKCLEKYGFSRYTKSKEFKIKASQAFLEKYGVDWYSKSKEFNEKFKKTCLEKYGVEHPMLDEGIKSKVSISNRDRYGENWFVETKEFKDKSLKIKEEKYGHPINTFKIKDYVLPSGKTVKVQGYENYALDILLKEHEESDIFISYSEIKEEIGILNYILENKDRIYIPDIYIKSENKIIEVKSDYTYNLDLQKNILKKESCLSMGINFEFWIIDKNGNLVNII